MQLFRKILPAVSVVLALLCLFGAVFSGFGTRLDWWDFRTGFAILKWSVYLVSVPVVLTVISAILSGSIKNPRYLIVVVTGLLVFGVPYLSVKEFRNTPTVADITTDFQDPPAFVDLVPVRRRTAQNPLEYRGSEAMELQRRYFPDLTGLRVQKSPAEVIREAAEVAKKMGMEIVALDPDSGRLEATATTFWFGFKDDFVVRARPQANGPTLVDIRSASRVGYLDGGVNGKRVKRFLLRLEAKDD